MSEVRKQRKPVLLIVDDEQNTREGLQKAFMHKYEVLLAGNAVQAEEILNRRNVDIVVTDLRMPGMDGMEFTKKVTAREDAPLLIMFTAYGSVQTAVDAMKYGAYDYLTKPVNLENLEMVIDRGLETRRLQAENENLNHELNSRFGLDGIIGSSKVMNNVLETVTQVAAARSTVLITGESGTGKELVAHAIHRLSPRAGKPFVAVHCAALNANLLESELFGHEKGAYTGAHERQLGRFENADGGTLFLDEIADIDPAIQIKLLRVLETRSFERVGGSKPIEVDVRLVAATNGDLKKLVDEGKFREDLYYRLHVVNIRLPALREREADVVMLLNHFLKDFCTENRKNLNGFTPDALKILTAYDWPGNVRELRNCVERMVVMARGTSLTLGDVPADVRTAVGEALQNRDNTDFSDPKQNAEKTALDIVTQERNLIIQALKECNGNRTEAAKRLGISRRTMHRKLHTYDLEAL